MIGINSFFESIETSSNIDRLDFLNFGELAEFDAT